MKSLIEKIMLFAFSLLLTACSLSITPIAPAQINLKPTNTPTLPPTQTPTPSPIFTPTIPTVDSVYLRDEFDGKLDPGWTWMREVPEQWSLATVPGYLQIDAGRGYVTLQNMSNVLLRPAPAGDFQIQTEVTFLPDSNFQFAGLIIYDNDANFLQAGHAYCHSGICVREGIYMDYYKDGIASPPNFAQVYKDNKVVALRLIRTGTTYTFEMSSDGRIFFRVGNIVSDMKPLQVGLIAGQNVEGVIIPALFNYFEVTSPQ